MAGFSGLNRNNALSRITNNYTASEAMPGGMQNSNADFPAPGSRTGYVYTSTQPNVYGTVTNTKEWNQRSRVLKSTVSNLLFDVVVIGGGGAGGRASSFGSGGGGGGGGMRVLPQIPLDTSSNVNITVGGGG